MWDTFFRAKLWFSLPLLHFGSSIQGLFPRIRNCESIHIYNYYLVKHTQIVIHGLILHVHRSACTIHYDFKTPCEETQWKYLQNMCNFCKCLQVMCWRLRNMWKYVMKSKVMWENIPQGKCTHLCTKRKCKVCLDDFQSMTSQVSIQNDLRIFRS